MPERLLKYRTASFIGLVKLSKPGPFLSFPSRIATTVVYCRAMKSLGYVFPNAFASASESYFS